MPKILAEDKLYKKSLEIFKSTSIRKPSFLSYQIFLKLSGEFLWLQWEMNSKFSLKFGSFLQITKIIFYI